MLTNRLLRTAVPIALAGLALTACGPDNSDPAAAPSATATTSAPPTTAAQGTFADPLALKTPANVPDTHFPENQVSRLRVTPVSVVRGDAAAVDKLGIGLLTGKVPYYVTTRYTLTGGEPDFGSFNFKLLLHGNDPKRAYFFAPSWGVKFAPCQEPTDEEQHLTVGQSVETCEIYLLPESVQPAYVGFQGERDAGNPSNETGSAPEVIWKVG